MLSGFRLNLVIIYTRLTRFGFNLFSELFYWSDGWGVVFHFSWAVHGCMWRGLIGSRYRCAHFFRVFIFDGLGVNDLVKMDGAIVCFLNDGEDGAEEDESFFSLMHVIILLLWIPWIDRGFQISQNSASIWMVVEFFRLSFSGHRTCNW